MALRGAERKWRSRGRATRVTPWLLAAAWLCVALVCADAAGHGHVASRVRDEVVLSPLPRDYVADSDVPRHWDWRNVDGVNYVTSDVNQHIPQYCGSCWIHGTVAALNDRVKISRRAAFPDVMLSRQALVNCAQNASGVAPGCNGGDPWMVFKTMLSAGIPDEACQPYDAQNHACTPAHVCRNCAADAASGCFAISRPGFVGYKVSEYGSVAGAANVMKEILARGPVTCSLVATDALVYNYSAVADANHGVFVDTQDYDEDKVDHDVEVVGWGETDQGTPFWVARNSWGTFWGDAGWFKLQRGTLRVEEDCWWGVPSFDNLEEYLDGEYVGSYDGMKKQTDADRRRSYRPEESHAKHPHASAHVSK